MKKELLFTLPSFSWLTIFFLLPTLMVFAYALAPQEVSFRTEYGPIFWRTIALSAVTTAVCLSVSLPLGYFLAQSSTRIQRLFLLLVIMPFWSSFLVRIFAWKTLLHPEGFVKKILTFLHIVDPDTFLLYNIGTVLVVMIYSYLPFAILPIYAQSVKFNYQLIEAARDLGAKPWQAFFSIFVPGIKKGILTACVLVCIPSIGAYVIPDLVGGTTSEMIGSKIAQAIFLERNLSAACALSAMLALLVLVPIAVSAYLHSRSARGKTMQETMKVKR